MERFNDDQGTVELLVQLKVLAGSTAGAGLVWVRA